MSAVEEAFIKHMFIVFFTLIPEPFVIFHMEGVGNEIAYFILYDVYEIALMDLYHLSLHLTVRG